MCGSKVPYVKKSKIKLITSNVRSAHVFVSVFVHAVHSSGDNDERH